MTNNGQTYATCWNRVTFFGRSDRFYKQMWQEVCRVVHLNGKIQNEEGEVEITSLNSQYRNFLCTTISSVVWPESGIIGQ